jgi:sugar phosphate isomerase/epimerase
MTTFSLAALTVLELAPPEMIELAALCGYEKVGLRLLPATPGGVAYRLMDDAPLLRETLRRLELTGVTVADLEVVAFRPETEMASFTPFFEVGARLGAKHILVAAYDPDLARFSDRYQQFCEAAASYGLTSDLEFMPWTSVPDLKTAMRIVGDVDHPGAGILVDALHWMRAGDRDALKPEQRDRLGYVQLCDGPLQGPVSQEALIQEARTNRLAPGEGEFPLQELLAAMPPHCVASVEVPLPSGQDALAHAKRLRQAARAVSERHEQKEFR